MPPQSGSPRKSLRLILAGLLALLSGLAIAASAGVPSVAADADTGTAVILLIIFVALALSLSFACSVAEAVLLSITPSYIESLRDKRPKLARRLSRLRLERVDESLAAILTLNTIAHTVGAIEAGAQAAVIFRSVWLGVFSAMMTLAILFLSEIIPKTLGAVYWVRLVTPIAMFIRLLVFVLYPLVWVSVWLTRFIAPGKSSHLFSRDEFMAMAQLGERTGQLDEHESVIIRNLFRFRLLKAKDIMTPSTVISSLPQHLTVEQAVKSTMNTPFSRLPLYSNNRDEITGFVLKDDILMNHSRSRGDMPLNALRRDILSVPDSITLPKLLEFLLDHRQQIATVVDEFGWIKGLVTLEDVVETLLGTEIMDETDNIEDMQAWAREKWTRRARELGLEIDDQNLPQD